MAAANLSPGPRLRAEHLVAGYYDGHPVLQGVSLDAKPGRVTVVLGPNGAGKSTALRVLAGFLKPRSGAVFFEDRDISLMPPHRRLELGIAFLPQGRSVFPDLTVHQNIELGGWIYRRDQHRLRTAVDLVYERYPNVARLRARPAGSLSGGQQRMVEIARMMVADPRVVLIDEPSAGLAPNLVGEVYRELADLKAEGRTILLVDQNIRAAVDIADYVFTLESGQNQMEGGREQFEGNLGTLIRTWLRVL